MKVFSFCIYGTERNYYEGLLENIQIIRDYFPDFKIYIYKGECDPTWTFEGDDLVIIETKRSGAINMLYRYLPVTFVQTGFILKHCVSSSFSLITGISAVHITPSADHPLDSGAVQIAHDAINTCYVNGFDPARIIEWCPIDMPN